MEMESQVTSSVHDHQVSNEDNNKKKMKSSSALKLSLLIVNCLVLSIGNTGGPLLLRSYFIHGGKRVWLSSWLETGGWPIMFVPLVASYLYRSRRSNAAIITNNNTVTSTAKKFFITRSLFMASAGLGILTGLDDYFYAYGVARLPVSTSALIISTQLAFTAAFAFLLVKQKFSSYSINSIVLLIVGSVVLALHASSDRPDEESNKQYYIGFFMTLGASALYGFILPMVEYTYKKSNQVITYTLVMEMQTVMSLFATGFCTVGMIINKDFQAIPGEAREYHLGEVKYYVVLACNLVIWQFFFLGAIGVIFCASSLLCGIMIAVLLPLTEILAVLFFHEKFKAEKGVALFLSLWSFLSYFYGDYKEIKKKKKKEAAESETHFLTLTPSQQT